MLRNSSFDVRVLVMVSIISSLNAWGLFEIFKQSSKSGSRHYYVLALAFIFQISMMFVRIYVSGQTHSLATNIYEEKDLPAMLRAIGLASNLLVYIAIGNILLERLWKREEKKSSNAELKMLSSLNALALARDNETGSHIIRTQSYVKLIAERLRKNGHYLDLLTDKKIEYLYKAAPLHDIGKVGIPDNILYKDGPLNRDEWGIMKTHTTIGEYVLSSARAQLDEEVEEEDVINTAIDIASSHHERWDGEGYPKGLAAHEIPLSARIMALADMYDALVSERVYKPEWRHQDAVQEILKKKGSHFDPLVVDAFIAEKEAFQAIAQKYKDDQSEFKIFSEVSQSSDHKLRRSEEKFQILFEHSPIGMALVDHATGEFLEANQALLSYTGYTKDEFLKLSFWDITPPEYAEQERSQIEQLNQKGFFGPNQKEYIRKDGSRFPILLRGFALNDVDGRKMVWGIIEDITIKQKIVKREAARNAVLELLAKNSPAEIALFQIVSDVERSYPNTFCSILLLNDDKQSFTVGAAPRIPRFFNEAVESLRVGPGVGCCGDAVATGQKSIAENLETHPNWAPAKSLVEQTGFKSCWSHPVHSSKGEILGTFATYRKEVHAPSAEEVAEIEAAANLVSIVLERKILENQVQKLALYDYLTGLPNRYLLMDRIKLAMSVSKRSKRYGAILFIDLDKLKELNDEYGHHMGDVLLTEAAKRLQSCIRESDTVARFGGDEFVIILSEISIDMDAAMEQVKIISKKILSALVEPYHLNADGKDIHYRSSASIGCQIFLDESDTPEHVLKLADMSMYRAKKLGGNRIDLLF
ncbi:diguanylate cyclase domain-containing protein [Polynucleobacter sinensis]|uniref:diguanylate cyclase domain-containing protein n=1 Tax=Polynucleobacter sinensis TaxID=1743157 RepID=UPI00155DF159|nr:diguanylate cyclase [Polynucleobacter sinensis]